MPWSRRTGYKYLLASIALYAVWQGAILGYHRNNSRGSRRLSRVNREAEHIDSGNIAAWTRTSRDTGIDCSGLIKGERQAQENAVAYMKRHPKTQVPDNVYIAITKNCTEFKKTRGYVTRPMTAEEEAFPIAYSLLMHKEVEQAERLLRAIYRPQNSYCIHIDKDARPIVIDAMSAIVNCFDNVFLATKSEKIIYAGFSRLKADLNCMADQIQYSKKWKYYLNLASQSFPLKTNSEIVRILKIYNGSNDIEGLPAMKQRIIYHYNYSAPRPGNIKPEIYNTLLHKEDPPHNVRIVKGSAYGVFSRFFVEFILTDQKARDLLEWSKDTYSPDEHFWSTLHHIHHNSFLKTPGGYVGRYERTHRKMYRRLISF